MEELKCPIRGHDHLRWLHPDGSLRCPKDGHRWVPASDELLKRLTGAPEVILRALKPEQVQGRTYVRRNRPHWGWPTGWRP